jgi:hypothetical protein
VSKCRSHSKSLYKNKDSGEEPAACILRDLNCTVNKSIGGFRKEKRTYSGPLFFADHQE